MTPSESSAEASRFRILIAVDQPIWFDMLRVALNNDFDLLSAVGDKDMMIQAAELARPDAALIDGSLPGVFDLGRRFIAAVPSIKIVYLTGTPGLDDMARAALADQPASVLLNAKSISDLRHTMLGLAGRTKAPAADISPVEVLSARQREVLALLVRGLPMKSVARQLDITQRTVAFHKYRAMEALGLRGNADLVRFAVQNGLLGETV